ncbi:glycosyltransferase family 2 protein [Candidatus Pelagibacter sp.]|jgi:dolichol-phosphate mannosyltransferase|nr:glycosyltransferase family 2 protein [Candidatus Pelagibacter sp.]
MSLSIIIPVFNEIDQLKFTIKKIITIKKKIKNIEIIFIDDFSKDNSSQYIKNYSKKNPLIKIFKNKKKGLGSAIKEGIIKSKNKYVCIFMCDMSDDINDLINYYKIINNEKKDAIFGTRFSKFSKVHNYPFLKLLLNRFSNYIIKLIFMSKYNDFTNAFKIYKRKTLLELFPIVSENFNVFLELPLKIISRNYSYKIIPINWNGRKHGVSKFKIKEVGSMYIFTLLYCLLERILLNKKK